MSASFWFIAGMLTGVTATAVVLPRWRSAARPEARRALRFAVASGGGCAVVAAAYLTFGSPRPLDQPATAAAPADHPASSLASPTGKAVSMAEATDRLERRLAQAGGSPQDWQLLAQSYEFMGRTEDAQRARKHAVGTASSQPATITDATLAAGQAIMAGSAFAPSAANPAATPADSLGGSVDSVPELEQRVRAHPTDSEAWLALADAHRQRRELAAARSAFRKAIALHGMGAQAWADYADVVGTLSGGTLDGEAAKAIQAALAIDPTNAKALWLEASRNHQQRRYAQALNVWQRLRTVLPSGSPDIPLVDANIAEAAQLAGVPNPQRAGDAATGSVAILPAATLQDPSSRGEGTGSAAGISGTVSIEDHLASRVEAGAVLFIYAKAVDSPGAPLAVMRVTATTWPVPFHLDDSMAMLPARRLSQFPRVVVEARISRTGQAAPGPGDLYVTSDVLSPGTARKVALVINRQIG
jgi:cytochrome c-type biogenesis protein CcmH